MTSIALRRTVRYEPLRTLGCGATSADGWSVLHARGTRARSSGSALVSADGSRLHLVPFDPRR